MSTESEFDAYPAMPATEVDARDRFVEGVLSIALSTTDASRRARVDACLRDCAEPAAEWRAKSSFFQSMQARWVGIAVAALIVIGFMVWPSASGSSHLLAMAARVEQLAVDRSFDFRLDPPDHDRHAPALFGRLDVRGPEQMLLLIDYPDGSRLLKGRDGARSWMRDRAGRFTEGVSLAWPGWVAAKDGDLVVDSIAALIASIDERYEIGAPQSTTLTDGKLATKIEAKLRSDVLEAGARATRSGTQPDAVALWLDPQSQRVLRAEVQWSSSRPRNGSGSPPSGFAQRPVRPLGGGPEGGAPSDRHPGDRPPPPPRDRASGGPELNGGLPSRLTISLKSEAPFREGYFSPESFILPE